MPLDREAPHPDIYMFPPKSPFRHRIVPIGKAPLKTNRSLPILQGPAGCPQFSSFPKFKVFLATKQKRKTFYSHILPKEDVWIFRFVLYAFVFATFIGTSKKLTSTARGDHSADLVENIQCNEIKFGENTTIPEKPRDSPLLIFLSTMPANGKNRWIKS